MPTGSPVTLRCWSWWLLLFVLARVTCPFTSAPAPLALLQENGVLIPIGFAGAALGTSRPSAAGSSSSPDSKGLGCVFGARLSPYLSSRFNPDWLKAIFAVIAIADGLLFIAQDLFRSSSAFAGSQEEQHSKQHQHQR